MLLQRLKRALQRRADGNHDPRLGLALADAQHFAIVSGPCEPLLTLHSLMLHSPVTPIVISFHTTAYFLLMNLMADCRARCAAIVNESVERRLAGVDDALLSRVEFHTRMSSRVLRSVRSGQCTLFIMADVFLPYGANAPLPFRDRALRYMISWAELAMRNGAPVVLCVLKDRGREADVHIERLPTGFASPFHLAFEAFRRFDLVLGDDDHLWENYPAIAKFGRPLPSSEGGITPGFGSR